MITASVSRAAKQLFGDDDRAVTCRRGRRAARGRRPAPLPGPRRRTRLAPMPRREWPPASTPRASATPPACCWCSRTTNANRERSLRFPLSAFTIGAHRPDRARRYAGARRPGVAAGRRRRAGRNLRAGGTPRGPRGGGARARPVRSRARSPRSTSRSVDSGCTRSSRPTPRRPHLTPSDNEVARILEMGSTNCWIRAHFIATERQRDGVTFTVPAFRIAK